MYHFGFLPEALTDREREGERDEMNTDPERSAYMLARSNYDSLSDSLTLLSLFNRARLI